MSSIIRLLAVLFTLSFVAHALPSSSNTLSKRMTHVPETINPKDYKIHQAWITLSVGAVISLHEGKATVESLMSDVRTYWTGQCFQALTPQKPDVTVNAYSYFQVNLPLTEQVRVDKSKPTFIVVVDLNCIQSTDLYPNPGPPVQDITANVNKYLDWTKDKAYRYLPDVQRQFDEYLGKK